MSTTAPRPPLRRSSSVGGGSYHRRAPAGVQQGSVEPPEKPCSEMSKSEKMSYSMRRKFHPLLLLCGVGHLS